MQKLTLIFLFLNLLIDQTLAQNLEFEEWKSGRKKELLAEDGWLNLVGLLWIDSENPYLNRISRDSLAISNKSNKNTIGTFEFSNDSVWFIFSPGMQRRNHPESRSKILQYPVESYSQGGVYFEHWKWTVINRGGQIGLRLRDLEHPALALFKPLPYFEYDSRLSVEAFFIPKFNETIDIPNVLGQVIEWKVLGILKFELEGKEYELTALDEAGKFFVIFSDSTNESETYPTGRYLYVNYPDQSGHTRIDFNFSYNPPCAFTAFATCPIPPKRNRLNLAIRAGEKVPKGK